MTPATDNSAADVRPDLSQEEVEALLENGVETTPARGEARSYDLIAHEKIVRGRMPMLDRINERWVAEFRRDVRGLIRRSVDVALREVQLLPCGEWQAALPVPTSFNLYSAKPWQRNVLVAVDGTLLFSLVDAYYGGAARKPATGLRETLTPTEQRLNQILAELLVGHFRAAFAPIATLDLQHLQSETNPNYVTIATPSEPMVVTRLEVTLNEVGGAICLAIPLASFEPVRDKLAEGLKTVSPEIEQRWRTSLRAQLETTELTLASVFLEMQISVRELLQLQPGDILPIELPTCAILKAGDRPLLRGKFGHSRGYNAVSVLEAVKPDGPTPTEEPLQ
jgi:flagellar motor switch protein FliM